MNYKTFQALLVLADEQGFKIDTVADFVKFAKSYYSKKSIISAKIEAERLVA